MTIEELEKKVLWIQRRQNEIMEEISEFKQGIAALCKSGWLSSQAKEELKEIDKKLKNGEFVEL